MYLYIEYESFKRKYYEAQQNFDTILSEQEKMFSRTQPRSTDFSKEPVNGGTPSNTFEEYMIEKEKKQIDERLNEAKLILNDRGKLVQLKLEELKESKNLYDKVYVAWYIDKIKVFHISRNISYSERQVYRMLKDIKREINKLGTKCQ